MNVLSEKSSYQKAADQFLKTYYENNSDDNIFFSYGFLRQFAKEARQIAKSLSLKYMDYQNAIVATWFRFAGITDISEKRTDASVALLNDYYNETDYPEEERAVVGDAINFAIDNKYAETKVQKVVCDATNSWLAWPNFSENIILLKEEVNRLAQTTKSELFYLKFYLEFFIKNRYYTDYANENYSIQREKNFQLLEKLIHKLESTENIISTTQAKSQNGLVLTDKETEDLFKIAFRNYNHLVSVADSKASLLINVNSIIISVVLGLVISKVEKNRFLLFPTMVLLIVCITTIFLSVLASRPQKNSFSKDKNSHSYQKFFFGSFDLIDPSFRNATWEGYYNQLYELFTNAKGNVYMELFKESYNVRKVLSKKFSYLSVAYWVFIFGLFLSIIAFVLSIQNKTIIG